MTYQQTFRSDLNVVYTQFDSHVDLEDLRRCAVETFRDPRYRAGMSELVDFRATTHPDSRLGYEAISAICEMQRSWIRNLRGNAHVVLVGGSDLVFGLMRIYATLLELQGVLASPCREWTVACRTLGLDPDTTLATQTAKG